MENFLLSTLSCCFILSLIFTILSINLIHSVFWLTLSFFWASFTLVFYELISIAFLVLIIYVGAIAILFVFSIMMVDITKISKRSSIIHLIPFILIIPIILNLFSINELNAKLSLINIWQPEYIHDLKEIGIVLFTEYYYLIVGSAFILLIPMIGVLSFT